MRNRRAVKIDWASCSRPQPRGPARPRGQCRLVGFLLLAVTATAVADERRPPPRRAKPPAWSQDIRALFFDDASQALEGERPDYLTLRSKGAPQAAAISGTATTATTEQSAGLSWSALVNSDTIETEIKRLAQLVAADVTSPAAFKGGGYQQCRGHFSVLAVLFAVAGQYDGSVRWQDAAPGLRDLFARAGFNCKTGTDQSFREASARKQDLVDLVRGNRPATAGAERESVWYEVADRPPLMQRLEQAQQERLNKWLAARNEFTRHRDDVLHEAQIVAMLGEVIQQEGFDYWDDPPYVEFAAELRDAARDLSAATVEEDYDAARAALGRATKACSNCHEHYRG